MSTNTMRLALFQGEYGGLFAYTDWAEKEVGRVRLSEYVDVEFPLLPKDEVIKNQVIAIDIKIAEINDEAIEKVSRLKQKKQELLALNHDEVNT